MCVCVCFLCCSFQDFSGDAKRSFGEQSVMSSSASRLELGGGRSGLPIHTCACTSGGFLPSGEGCQRWRQAQSGAPLGIRGHVAGAFIACVRSAGQRSVAAGRLIAMLGKLVSACSPAHAGRRHCVTLLVDVGASLAYLRTRSSHFEAVKPQRDAPERGLSIDGSRMTHICWADDTLLIAKAAALVELDIFVGTSSPRHCRSRCEVGQVHVDTNPETQPRHSGAAPHARMRQFTPHDGASPRTLPSSARRLCADRWRTRPRIQGGHPSSMGGVPRQAGALADPGPLCTETASAADDYVRKSRRA